MPTLTRRDEDHAPPVPLPGRLRRDPLDLSNGPCRDPGRGRDAGHHARPALARLGRDGPDRSPPREKRGELTARALVFKKGDVSVAIVGLDLLGFPSVLGDRVRAKVARIPAGEHPHRVEPHPQRPDCYAFPDGQGGHTGDLKYMDFVCDKAAEAINEAIDRLEPAWIKVATGEAKGKIAYNYYAPDLYDRRMSVIQAVRPDGQGDRDARQLRDPSRGARQRRRHPQPRPDRAALRRDRGEGRRDGRVHERGAGRDGHRRQPQPRRPQGRPARLLERRPPLGRMPADRPPDGRRGAADRQGRAGRRRTRRSSATRSPCGSPSIRRRCGPS